MQYFLVGLVVLLVIAMVALLIIYLKIKKVNDKLHKQQLENEIQRNKLEEANKELEQAKNHAEKVSGYKSEFLANISHAIRTPLNAITGYIYLVQKQLDPDNANTYIHNVLVASENLGVIVNDLLDISKIEAGKMVIEKTNFNPMSIVTQAISTLKGMAEEKNIALELHLDPLVPDHLVGDPYRLSQILINLINNAIKFSANGQEVSINMEFELQNKECLLKIGVADKGIGIEEQVLETIFESFSQVSNSIARNQTGTGMGLAIVKRLVELQEGSIAVESEPGVGSKFKFQIPYEVCELDEGNVKGVAFYDNDEETNKGISVLLVEDNEINQELAIDTINSWGLPFKIEVANNGLEALELIEKHTYQIILMDIMMPIMDGHETTIRIRQTLEGEKSHIPIIGMTAHAFTEERKTALENGMNAYITKPFNPEELKQKMLSFVSK